MPENFVGEFTEHADDAWITANGARMVARAWTDPEYRTRMLASTMAPPGFAVAWSFDRCPHGMCFRRLGLRRSDGRSFLRDVVSRFAGSASLVVD
jgi:hypothetical protein